MSDEIPRPRRSDRHKKARLHTPREIRGLEPAATARQGASALHPRKRSDALDPQARRRRRGRIAIIVAAVFALLLVAGGVYAYAFVAKINGQIHQVKLSDAFTTQLASDAPAPGAPFYMLLMGDDKRPGEVQARSDTLMVARIDPKLRKVQLMSILRDSRVNIPGVGMDKINAAPSLGGPELAMKTVRELTGLPITKFLTVDFTGFQSIVDAMGGVWLDVPTKINGVPPGKPITAWEQKNRIIKKGYQKLNGIQALTFVRARHQFADQDYTRVKDQQLFLKALVKQALQVSKVFSAQQMIQAVADHMRTNMSLSDLANLALQMRGMKDTDLETATAPGTPQYIGGVSYVVLDDVKFSAMIGRMKLGQPLEPKTATSTTTPAAASSSVPVASNVTITIRNGAGVSGLAKQASTFFTSKGFKIASQGNAAQFVYGKTLVVYKSGGDAKASAVATALGFGQAVPAGGMYQFNSDVLVVIGKDWKDPSTTQVH